MALYVFNLYEAEAPYAEAGQALLDEIMEAHRAFSAAVVAAGAKIIAGEALLDTSSATFLRHTRTDQVQVIDNPLPEVTEILGGFYVIEAETPELALELAKQCPAKFGYVEVRPVWDTSQLH